MTNGRQLAAARVALHMNQQEVASLIGRSLRTVQRIESDSITPLKMDVPLLMQLYEKAKLKRPPNLAEILLLKGRVAALKALTAGAPRVI